MLLGFRVAITREPPPETVYAPGNGFFMYVFLGLRFQSKDRHVKTTNAEA
jgi:hypothetical protein